MCPRSRLFNPSPICYPNLSNYLKENHNHPLYKLYMKPNYLFPPIPHYHYSNRSFPLLRLLSCLIPQSDFQSHFQQNHCASSTNLLRILLKLSYNRFYFLQVTVRIFPFVFSPTPFVLSLFLFVISPTPFVFSLFLFVFSPFKFILFISLILVVHSV